MTPDEMRSRPLWTCPQCRHRFVSRNLSHSCVRVPLAAHFQGKDPALWQLFKQYRAFVRRCGPIKVYAQKTRIVFQVRARFTGAVVRSRWLESALWLKRFADDPHFTRIEQYTPRDYVHFFRLTSSEQLDAGLAALVREAYDVGAQRAPATAAADGPQEKLRRPRIWRRHSPGAPLVLQR
ncbi:MAG: DUF5655 domain-containing protein [Planctomycetota bacterium]